MNSKTKQFMTISLFASLLLVGLILLNSCKKSEPTTPPEPNEEVASATIEQTTCPIMGGPIDKKCFTEHEGKKVYFCCPGCEEKFKESPEKYVAKLPQFKD